MNILQNYQQKTFPWQQELVEVISDPVELWNHLELDPKLLPDAKRAAKLFDLRVPQSYVDKIKRGDINDPLLKQILPLGEELINKAGFIKDPLQEKNANPIPGLLHKYHGRVLLTVVSACGINCRYCFRRHFNYAENNVGSLGRQRILDYLSTDESIQEVIYSGGDPLLAGDDYLQQLTHEIMAIPHIKRLRIHSRLPVVIPSRITDEFIAWFSALEQSVLVVHCNHPNELDERISHAMKRLKQAGVTILNQSVLLRGVNDNSDTLVELSEKLFASHILPYYLHLFDPVQNAAHFDIDRETALKLYDEMQARLPGYLVPKLAKEISGESSKKIVA